MFVYKLDRFASEYVGNVLAQILFRANIVAKYRVNPISGVRVVIDPVIAMTIEVIEAALQWQVSLGLSHVPFADDRIYITRFLQHIADREFFWIESQRHFWRNFVFVLRESMPVIGHVVSNHVVEPVTLWIASGQQASTRGVHAGQVP